MLSGPMSTPTPSTPKAGPHCQGEVAAVPPPSACRTSKTKPAAPGEMRVVVWQSITPGFFRALRIPLLKGRLLTAQDGPDAPLVIVISQSMGHRIWPNQDPLGKRI
jgi:hypothetical protein